MCFEEKDQRLKKCSSGQNYVQQIRKLCPKNFLFTTLCKKYSGKQIKNIFHILFHTNYFQYFYKELALEFTDSRMLMWKLTIAVFLNQRDASYLWNLSIDWIGCELLKIIIDSVTQHLLTQKCSCILSTMFSLMLHHISANGSMLFCIIILMKNVIKNCYNA
jgi:hypothetical protein